MLVTTYGYGSAAAITKCSARWASARFNKVTAEKNGLGYGVVRSAGSGEKDVAAFKKK